MKFIVTDEVFSRLGNVCFGVVVARGLDNRTCLAAIDQLLNESISRVEQKFQSTKVKEAAEVAPYREAFTTLGINPNKFMSSIEAMASRIEKKKGFPNINTVVDLGNAVSLKHLVPMGAHDIDGVEGDVQVRFSCQGDRFTPFGETTEEIVDAGELIYSVGDKVKTRRWIWRQSEHGKVTESSTNVFFPIDGFNGVNRDCVLAARDELASMLVQHFKCEVKVGLVDRDNREMDL